MKRKKGSFTILMAMAALLFLFSISYGQDRPFRVARLVISEDVVDREPVGVGEAFPATLQKVYCFLEARDITRDTVVTFVWIYKDRELARVELPLKKGLRWRTYSSKRLGGLRGEWTVEVRDEEDRVVEALHFTVE